MNILLVTRFDAEGAKYIIFASDEDYCEMRDDQIVYSFPVGDDDEDPYPTAVREKYEALLGRPEFLDDAGPASKANLVEIIAGDKNAGFQQPCRYGHLVEDHAVYCHNERWLYAPRKCCRTWYSGGKVRDEDCRGFSPNPNLDRQS